MTIAGPAGAVTVARSAVAEPAGGAAPAPATTAVAVPAPATAAAVVPAPTTAAAVVPVAAATPSAPRRAPTGPSALRAAVGLRRDLLNTLLDAHRNYGDVVRFAFGPPGARTVLYAVFHPDDVQRVLPGHADDFRNDNVFYEEIRWGFGNGLLTSQDGDWRRQRRFVQPLFTRRRISGYAATMTAETEQVVAAGRPLAAAGATVDLDSAMTALTLQIVGRILFGSDTHHVLPTVRSAFAVLGQHARRRALSPLAPPRDWPGSRHRRAVAARHAMHTACQELIDARRRAGTAGDDLLGRLLAAEDEDLLFLLTTNRPDVIEPALAARPGRIDLALEIPLPDDDGRRRLLALYGKDIAIDRATQDALVERSAGVSGAFIKELTRQAWLRGALEDRDAPTGENLLDVLDELLEERSTLTRRLLGQPGDGAAARGGEEPFPAMVHALTAAGLPIPPSVSFRSNP